MWLDVVLKPVLFRSNLSLEPGSRTRAQGPRIIVRAADSQRCALSVVTPRLEANTKPRHPDADSDGCDRRRCEPLMLLAAARQPQLLEGPEDGIGSKANEDRRRL